MKAMRIEQGHQLRWHFHQVVCHQRLNLLLLLLFGGSRRRPSSEVSAVPPGHQVEVSEEDEQPVAGLCQLQCSIVSGGPGAGGQLRIEVRKEDVVSVFLRMGVHSRGETGKGTFYGSHRLRGEVSALEVGVVPIQWLDAIICDHCSGRSGRLFFVFLLRRVAAIDAVKGPNDGDEGANKAKSEQTCD
ncbi:hypothetical protein TYRP_006388 [Tyrophagus putrescentiae]|nr:hypothetical protein TYRP_006388 [Tyrophagus putrescentiae]